MISEETRQRKINLENTIKVFKEKIEPLQNELDEIEKLEQSIKRKNK